LYVKKLQKVWVGAADQTTRKSRKRDFPSMYRRRHIPNHKRVQPRHPPPLWRGRWPRFSRKLHAQTLPSNSSYFEHTESTCEQYIASIITIQSTSAFSACQMSLRARLPQYPWVISSSSSLSLSLTSLSSSLPSPSSLSSPLSSLHLQAHCINNHHHLHYILHRSVWARLPQ
jgi:hypothetical protein